MKFITVLLLLHSCIGEDVHFRNWNQSEISIYLVKDGQLDRFATEVDLESLALENEQWVKSSEIRFYDWSSHIFYLNVEKEKEKHSGRFFVVKSDQQPLFLGLFFPLYWSSIPRFPSVIAHDDFFYPIDVVGLGGYGFSESTSLNSNQEFRLALEESGLLKEGIHVELTGLNWENSTTVSYTYRVTNLDAEYIYILDPDKMGASRFHYYTNGVSLIQGNNYYSAENIAATPSEKIDAAWYYKLAPGKSVKRTVQMEGFRQIPSGTVKATFYFPGSTLKRGEWQKSDGRVWLGRFKAENEFSLR
ncbi:MAG: hypothetical protein EOM73_06220 [Bacteroidia bacterium]|nr:hypothetical protein [Bacteroidia bacterium]